MPIAILSPTHAFHPAAPFIARIRTYEASQSIIHTFLPFACRPCKKWRYKSADFPQLPMRWKIDFQIRVQRSDHRAEILDVLKPLDQSWIEKNGETKRVREREREKKAKKNALL